MKRIALFVVASMLLAACGSGGGSFVASVNDFDITLADVEALSPQAEDGSIDQTCRQGMKSAPSLFQGVGPPVAHPS